MKAIVTVGIPASGKSTFAKDMCKDGNYVDVNRDAIRRMITSDVNLSNYYEGSKRLLREREKSVTELHKILISANALAGRNIVVSDTNLTESHRESLIKELKELGYEVETKVFHISLQDALKRDSLRANGVGQEVIYKMYLKYLEQYKAKYVPDVSKPKAVIVDIDGTLAHNNGHRGFFEWDKVINDEPVKLIVDMIKGLYFAGYKVIIFSGRDMECQPDTMKWLNKHGISYNFLEMRLHGDNRCDTVVKKEMFIDIAADFNIVGVIDDRPKVVQMWHDLGLKVISVADQGIKF